MVFVRDDAAVALPSPRQEVKTSMRLARIFFMIFVAGRVAVVVGGTIAYSVADRAPGELMRYVERRLIGHPKLEFFSKPFFAQVRPLIERPAISPIPAMGAGQQAGIFSPQEYDPNGHPLAARRAAVGSGGYVATTYIAPGDDIAKVLLAAKPGDVIELTPGTYSMRRTVRIRNGGAAGMPIVLRAAEPGTVVIEKTSSEGFHLHAPYWVFENLVIKGTCPVHSNCEHAFHIVGGAHSIVIRNNRIEDFNAQIKVNGFGSHWPDFGLVQYNTLSNSVPRNTSHPVTPVDIVAADGWVTADNIIEHFVKLDGNQIAYGVFMKGGGNNGKIERNVVNCARSDISQKGKRVGVGLGGGGTNPASLCRDGRCVTEFSNGAITDNLIANCNDFGVYVNKSNQTSISGNVLLNTYGIDVRFGESSAQVTQNVVEGIVRARDGASVRAADNTQPWRADIQSAYSDLTARYSLTR